LLSFGAEYLSSGLQSKNIKIKKHRSIILPVVLYGCEAQSLTLREERTLRVFENGVLGKVLGAKRDDVTGKLRRLHNKELCDRYSIPNYIRVMKLKRKKWAGYVEWMGDSRGAFRVLVGRLMEGEPLEDLGTDRRKILKWILKKWNGGLDWLDLS
jgi:hypothetical protein